MALFPHLRHSTVRLNELMRSSSAVGQVARAEPILEQHNKEQRVARADRFVAL